MVLSNRPKLVKDFVDKELAEGDLSKMVRVWEEFEDCSRYSDTIDSFFSKCERCYNALVATSVFDNMCSYLELILGGCPGTKNSKVAGQVKVQASSEEESVFWTSSDEGFGTKSSKMTVQVKDESSSEEEGVFWTSRGERFGNKNSKVAVQVKDEVRG